MNFFAAHAIRSGFSTEEAFWFLAGIVEHCLIDSFSPGLNGVVVDCEVCVCVGGKVDGWVALDAVCVHVRFFVRACMRACVCILCQITFVRACTCVCG
jgi:hypothetical protein